MLDEQSSQEENMDSVEYKYGVGDNSYKAAGEISGLIKLVDSFYGFMDVLPEAKHIREMHGDDLTSLKTRLAYFLSGWLGGPRLYSENFGPISIPSAHKQFPINFDESDAWILCMQNAVDEQPYEESFKIYLIAQLRIPAERIRVTCSPQ